jgi:hypothetical protein
MSEKSQVNSWRLSRELKHSLEAEAHRRNLGLADLLEEVTRGWLAREAPSGETDREILARARRSFGALASGAGSRRSEQVRELVRDKLKAKHGRERAR